MKKVIPCRLQGRNPDNPSDRRAGIPLVQIIEIKKECIAYTITTVQKDSMVLEIWIDV